MRLRLYFTLSTPTHSHTHTRTHTHTHAHTHSLPLSFSLEDASDTRRLLTEEDSSHNYGSAPSLSDPATRGERRSLRDRLHSLWPDFSHLLSLAKFWTHQKTQAPNRRIAINSDFPESNAFCSNRIRYNSRLL